MKNNSKTVALIGVMSALMFVIMLVESYVLSIIFELATPCILSISLAITLSVYDDYKKMFVGGTIMGVCSLVVAFIIGNPAFIFPWISVLPRIFIGVISFSVSLLVKKITKKSTNNFVCNYLPYSLGAMFGVITNTLLVLTMLYISSFIGVSEIVGTFVAINFPLEIVGSMIVVPILVNAIRKYLHK